MFTLAVAHTASARPSLMSLSSVGTVLIWSRCEGARGLEYRLIGSAIGEASTWDGLRFTGRHWWGNIITRRIVSSLLLAMLARGTRQGDFRRPTSIR